MPHLAEGRGGLIDCENALALENPLTRGSLVLISSTLHPCAELRLQFSAAPGPSVRPAFAAVDHLWKRRQRRWPVAIGRSPDSTHRQLRGWGLFGRRAPGDSRRELCPGPCQRLSTQGDAGRPVRSELSEKRNDAENRATSSFTAPAASCSFVGIINRLSSRRACWSRIVQRLATSIGSEPGHKGTHSLRLTKSLAGTAWTRTKLPALGPPQPYQLTSWSKKPWLSDHRTFRRK